MFLDRPSHRGTNLGAAMDRADVGLHADRGKQLAQLLDARLVVARSRAGNDKARVEQLRQLFAAVGMKPDIRAVHGGAEIRAAVRRAVEKHPRLIVAGGGDGTVSSVAAALVDTDIAFGVLPLGTLNHFARDLGIPLELAEAIAVLVQGRAARV